ncbi:hypothetical protein GC177_08105 [bacterium]|nr:hypothetical protein [bacterium]
MSDYNWVPSYNSRNMSDRYRQYSERANEHGSADSSSKAEKSSELSFGDVVDAINPLQQLPIVGSIYRAVTGDQISDAARVMGGTLYGGPIGAAVAVATVTLKNEEGLDLDKPVMAMLGKEQQPTDESATMLADASDATDSDVKDTTVMAATEDPNVFDVADSADAAQQAAPTVPVASSALPSVENNADASLDVAEAPKEAPVKLASIPTPADKPDAPVHAMHKTSEHPVTFRPAGSRSFSLDAYRNGTVTHEGFTRPEPARVGAPSRANRDIEASPALIASLMADSDSSTAAAMAQGGPESPLPLDMGGMVPPMREAGSTLTKKEAMRTVLETMQDLSSIKTLPPELANAPVPVAKPVNHVAKEAANLSAADNT